MLLFVVENTFDIRDQGLILTPGLGKHAAKIGIRIRLVRPDGTELHTYIKGIAFHTYRDILVGEGVRKADVPIGTEVWLDM